jgi:hypothetical protein
MSSVNCPEIKIGTAVGCFGHPPLVMPGGGEGKMRVRHANVRHSARGGEALNFDGLTVYVFKSAISP